jgi:hypothetical protein
LSQLHHSQAQAEAQAQFWQRDLRGVKVRPPKCKIIVEAIGNE